MELYSPEHPSAPQCLILTVGSFVLGLDLNALTAAGWVSATRGLLWACFAGAAAAMERRNARRLGPGSDFPQSWWCSAPVAVSLSLLGLLSVKIPICTCCGHKQSAAGTLLGPDYPTRSD